MINLTSYEYIDRAVSELDGCLESDKFEKNLDSDDRAMIAEAMEILTELRRWYRGIKP